MDIRFIQTPDTDALKRTACARILRAAERAIEQRGTFSIVLAGGETPKNIYTALRTASTPWERWQIFFGDERCVPVTDPRRNSLMVAQAWLDHVNIPSQNIHAIAAELGPDEGARLANQQLAGVNTFDLVLLGLGDDGHTASLFPGHAWGTDAAAKDALPIRNAPKPPPERVSLSAKRLSDAREVLFLVQGESKRSAVSAFREHSDRTPIPAAAIQPPTGVDVLIPVSLLAPP